MIVNDFIIDVAQRATQSATQALTNNENLTDHLLRNFNMFHKDFNKRYPWPWRQREAIIQTVANYTTGTVSVSNGSRSVLGVGTAWSSAMVGRIFKLDREEEFYEILSVSSTGLIILKTPYLGASGSGTYLIWKKYYELPPDVPYLSEITMARWPYKDNEIPKKSFDANLIRGWQTNNYSLVWTWGGIDNTIKTYAVGTGTITALAGSRTVTGALTTFLDNVFPGSKLVIVDKAYNVETVDSDTQLTLVQQVKTPATSESNFTITTQGRSRIQLSSVPDPQINLLLTYSKKTYDLGVTDDVDFWEGHEHILTNVMYGYLLEKLTSDKSFAWYDIYRANIKEAWINLNERDSIDQVPRFQRRTLSNYRPTIYSD